MGGYQLVKSLLLENKKMFILYVIACFIPVVSQLLQIGLIALIFETVERQTMEFFRLAMLLAGIFLVVNFLLYVFSRMLRISYMRDVLLSLRIRAFERVINMSYKRFNKQSRDVYVSNLINDINTVESSFFLSLINFIFRCGLYVCVLIALAFLNWQIAILVLVASLLVLGLSRLYEKKTVSLQKEVSSENEAFTTDVANTFTGLEILKLNNIEPIFLRKNQDRIVLLENKKFKFNVFTSLQIYTNVSIGFLILIGLLVYVMYQTRAGLGYGEMVLTIQLASSAVFPLVNMMPLINVLKSANAIYEKITTIEIEEKSDMKKKPFTFNREIKLNEVSFSFEDKEVFKSIDFTLEKGKKYLLKGPSGSGKTTLIKLMAQVIDDYVGKITVDGIDLRQIDVKSFNDKVAFIYQEVFLFENSLKDNITLFKDYSDEEVIEACQLAGLGEFIEKLPEGIHTMIHENGKNLSGGERQRVSIARALLKKAEILFVDEATSSLNDELGIEIEKTILSLDATVLAITHKTFPGVSNQYHSVLEIKDGFITIFDAKEYFEEVQ